MQAIHRVIATQELALLAIESQQALLLHAVDDNMHDPDRTQRLPLFIGKNTAIVERTKVA